MEFGKCEVTRLIEEIWQSLLGWEASPLDDLPEPAADDCWTGCVAITGAWNGRILLRCHGELLKEATAAILQLTPEALSPELMRDALCELTNIVGGNLKALVGGKCSLGLPAVLDDEDAARGSSFRPVLQMAFQSRGRPMILEVCEQAPVPVLL